MGHPEPCAALWSAKHHCWICAFSPTAEAQNIEEPYNEVYVNCLHPTRFLQCLNTGSAAALGRGWLFGASELPYEPLLRVTSLNKLSSESLANKPPRFVWSSRLFSAHSKNLSAELPSPVPCWTDTTADSAARQLRTKKCPRYSLSVIRHRQSAWHRMRAEAAGAGPPRKCKNS